MDTYALPPGCQQIRWCLESLRIRRRARVRSPSRSLMCSRPSRHCAILHIVTGTRRECTARGGTHEGGSHACTEGNIREGSRRRRRRWRRWPKRESRLAKSDWERADAPRTGLEDQWRLSLNGRSCRSVVRTDGGRGPAQPPGTPGARQVSGTLWQTAVDALVADAGRRRGVCLLWRRRGVIAVPGDFEVT